MIPENTISRFIEFYNNERLHSAIDYKAPKEVVGKYLGYHCTSDDVKKAIDFAFLDKGIERISHVRIRSDNGTQFVSRTVDLFLSSSKIDHERIHPATPKEDAHIESFNSILEKEVIGRFEFSYLENTENTISRFIESYNNERLHSAIDYKHQDISKKKFLIRHFFKLRDWINF